MVEKTKILTREEEYALGAKVQAGLEAKARSENNETPEPGDSRLLADYEEAFATFFDRNQGLVISLANAAHRRYPTSLEIQDLVQEGSIGLMTAIKKYDPSRGNKFSTVAFRWINQAISRGVNKTHRLVRLPENRIADFTKMNRIHEEFEDTDVTSAELDEVIRERLGLTDREISDIRAAASSPASLNKTVGTDSDGTKTLMDYVGDLQTTVSSEEEAINSDIASFLSTSLASLPELNRAVVTAQFGLPFEDQETRKPKQVREIYKINQDKYREVLSSSIESLREDLSGNGFTFSDLSEALA